MREPRGDVTRQRHDLFRRSTTKEERPGSRHLIAACPSPTLTISIAQCEAHRDQRDQRRPLSPKRPPAAEASRPPPGHRECNVGATLAHSGWSRLVVKGSRPAVSAERRVVQMIAERGVRFCAPPRREPARSHGYEASPPVEHVRDFRCEEAGLLSQEHPSATNEGAAVRPRRRVDGQIAKAAGIRSFA